MLNRQKHQVVLIKILKDIYKNPEIANSLVFKGGTCAQLFYGLDRFSTDLDFSLLNPNEAKIIFRELKKIASQYGKLKDDWIKQDTILIELSYGIGDRNVKIEVSIRKEVLNTEVKNYLGINVVTLPLPDIFAGKLLALMGRKKVANRDLYDLYFFFQQGYPLNEELLAEKSKKKPAQYLATAKDFILSKVDRSKILDGLGEVMDSKKKKWIKEKLIDELAWQIEAYLAGLNS